MKAHARAIEVHFHKEILLKRVHNMHLGYILIALSAIAITFVVDNGLGAVTLGAVGRRLFDAIADVFFDRGVGGGIE